MLLSAPHSYATHLERRVSEAVQRSIVLDANILLDVGVFGLEGPRAFQDVLEAHWATLAVFTRLVCVIKSECSLGQSHLVSRSLKLFKFGRSKLLCSLERLELRLRLLIFTFLIARIDGVFARSLVEDALDFH